MYDKLHKITVGGGPSLVARRLQINMDISIKIGMARATEDSRPYEISRIACV